MAFRYLVFDFDGTCTDVPAAADAFLEAYRELADAAVGPCPPDAWADALAAVRAASPEAGWTLAETPSAPAAADPYILAYEALRTLLRAAGRPVTAPRDLHARAVARAEAPWRVEAAEVLAEATRRVETVAFISNSGTATVAGRLDHLLAGAADVRARIAVHGDAAKFTVREPRWAAGVPAALRERFLDLPAAAPRPDAADAPRRPIYLRRGAYYEALCRVWGADVDAPAHTLIVGDIHELDLALPLALGCAVHLIERAAPFATCAYERAAASPHVSADLRGVLTRL
jgi:FMN phosphatase YigB (HAD superfamily)